MKAYNNILKHFSLISSLLLHFITVLIFTFINPSNNTKLLKTVLNQDNFITIDTISLAKINNIKLQSKVSQSKKEVLYNGNDKKSSNLNASISHNKADEKTKILSINTKEQIQKPLQTKKKTNKPLIVSDIENNKESTPQTELASILKSVQKSKEDEKISNTSNNQDGIIGKGKVNYNELLPMSMRAIDEIRSKFIKCWIVPSGARNAENLVIQVHVTLNKEGKVLNAHVTNNNNKNPFFQIMADSALRAVYRCSPLSSLPKEEYIYWHELNLSFNPKEMF